jgi:hypothetical protein
MKLQFLLFITTLFTFIQTEENWDIYEKRILLDYANNYIIILLQWTQF